MRLLNVKTRRLEEFHGDTIPPYAILSHTWGLDEVSFQDLASEDHKQKHGYRKIEGCCYAAAEQRIKYVWVDSCCIDKSSSAELSEAINSMFKWYEASNVCFIYLEDVPTGLDPFAPESAFRRSRWWTRGWTLQELLAPRHTIFFDSTWERVFRSEASQDLFKKIVLPSRDEQLLIHRQQPPEDRIQAFIQQIRYGLLTEISGIPGVVLAKELPLSEVSAACKFSWASRRMTTRIEDKAYCLMGLLGVNMPLLYGEGDNAFVRLQQALISSSDDISLLAWGYGLGWEEIEHFGYEKVLARSPAAFRGYPASKYRHNRRPPKTHSTVTGHGLHIELPLLLLDAKNRVWISIIEEDSDEFRGGSGSIALVLKQKSVHDTHIFERTRGCTVLRIPNFHSNTRISKRLISKMIYLQDGGTVSAPPGPDATFHPFRLLGPFLKSTKRRIDKPSYTAELALFIWSFRKFGYTVSSRYPPMDHDMVSLFAQEAHSWELSDGQFTSHYKSHFEILRCHGPGAERFYFILTNAKGHSVAVKVQIRYRPPYIDRYKVELSDCGYDGMFTAMVYVCGIGFKKDSVTKFNRKDQWKSYINLRSPTNAKIHVCAYPSQQQLSNKNVRYVQCSLMWSGGWVSEDDQHYTGL